MFGVPNALIWSGLAALRVSATSAETYAGAILSRYGETFAAGARFDRAIAHAAIMRVGARGALRLAPLARAGFLRMLDLGGRPSGGWERAVDALVRAVARGAGTPHG